MQLTVGILKQVIKDLPDNVILASLRIGNDEFDPFLSVKRLIILQDKQGNEYLTINEMGSHFTGKGNQDSLVWNGEEWNQFTIMNKLGI